MIKFSIWMGIAATFLLLLLTAHAILVHRHERNPFENLPGHGAFVVYILYPVLLVLSMLSFALNRRVNRKVHWRMTLLFLFNIILSFYFLFIYPLYTGF